MEVQIMDNEQYNYDDGVERLTNLITEMHSHKDIIAKYLSEESGISQKDGLMILNNIDQKFSELINLLTEPTEFDD